MSTITNYDSNNKPKKPGISVLSNGRIQVEIGEEQLGDLYTICERAGIEAYSEEVCSLTYRHFGDKDNVTEEYLRVIEGDDIIPYYRPRKDNKDDLLQNIAYVTETEIEDFKKVLE